jgi:hypothetical protein
VTPVVASIVALAVAGLAAGCGSSTINQSSEVDLVNKQLQSSHLKSKSVDCPDNVDAKEGTTFKCTVTLANGKTGTYTIRVEKVSGDNATLQIIDAQNGT